MPATFNYANGDVELRQCILCRNSGPFKRLRSKLWQLWEAGVRIFSVAIIAGVGIALSTVAFAESWRAKPVLEARSPLLCRQADVSKLFFAFAEMGNDLSVKAGESDAFLVPVSADGSIARTISIPVGQKTFTVDLIGNAKGRDLQVYNRDYACLFKLQPVP